MSKTAFVTGGTGFVGSHLVEELQRRGYGEVRCLVRSEPKWLAGMDVVQVRGDLSSTAVLGEAVRGVDYVYHVAGVTRAPDWQTFRQGNIEGTLNLLAAVQTENPAVKKVLVTSSLAAVGRCEGDVANEETPLSPVSRYGRSKAEMEQALAAPGLGYAERLPLVIVRPPSVYGPREEDIFGLFKLADRGLFPMTGPADVPYLSLVHVRDLVRGMVEAAESPAAAGEVYFIGSEEQYSWKEIKRAMTDALGGRALTLPVPRFLVGLLGAAAERMGDLLGAFDREKAREALYACKMCAVEKAKRDLGYRQEVSLEEGMRETARWYRAQGWLS